MNEITNLLVALIPSVAGVLSCVGVFIGSIVKVKQLRNDAAETNRVLQDRIKALVYDNAELIKKLNELELNNFKINSSLLQKIEEVKAALETDLKSIDVSAVQKEINIIKKQLSLLVKEK